MHNILELIRKDEIMKSQMIYPVIPTCCCHQKMGIRENKRYERKGAS